MRKNDKAYKIAGVSAMGSRVAELCSLGAVSVCSASPCDAYAAHQPLPCGGPRCPERGQKRRWGQRRPPCRTVFYRSLLTVYCLLFSVLLPSGDLTAAEELLSATPGELHHSGYDFYNDNYHNLNANGGLMVQTPSAEVSLTTGPGGRGFDFNDDTDFKNSGAISIDNYYMNLFDGCFIAQETGVHEFRIYQADDVATMWLDINQNGIFEAPGGLGTGENIEYIVWANIGTAKQCSLTAGQIYRFAVTHREGAGGSAIDVRFKTPSGSEVVIKPGDPAQSNYWAAGTYAAVATPTAPTDVTQTSATLNGLLTMTNGLTYVWIYWGPTDEGTNKLAWANSAIVAGGAAQATGQVSIAASPMTPQTTYYHRLYVSNAAWQVFSSVAGSFETLNSMTWDGDVDDLWWRTNNWAGNNVPDNTNEYAVFSMTGVGSVDLQEFSYTIGSLTFLHGGYNIIDPNEVPGLLTMGSLTNAVGTNTVSVGVTLSGDAIVKGGKLVLADPNDFSAASLILTGGSAHIRSPLDLEMGKLNHWGYAGTDEALNNLNNNGGLFTNTPLGQVYLTTGPAGRGLNFDTDADFVNSGAVNIWDNYLNLFHGYFVADQTGNYEFKVNQDDDRSSMWLDINQNGVFEAPTGFRSGENIAWEDGGVKTYTLIAGEAYRFAVTHEEWGGGSGIDVSFKSPSMGGHATIKPGDLTQSKYWGVGSYGAISMSDTAIKIVTNATLTVSGTSAALGALTVMNGSTLTITGQGVVDGVTFADSTITGNVTITAGDFVMNSFFATAASVLTINSGAGLALDSSPTVNSILANGTFSAPGTITASTKMSFEPVRTITNVLAGAAAVYYGENRTVNGIITATGANTYSGGTWIRRAILRATSGAGLPAAGCLRFWSGNGNGEDALLETSGTFTRNIGTGSGEVYWEGSGGFSALGGPLEVKLEGGADLNWGDGNTGFNGQYLQLNSDYADNVLTITNNIDLNASGRNIYVRDNTATKADMVILSGVISGSNAGDWLYRRGRGLLWLTATNTFQQRIFFEDCGPIRADPGVGIPNNSMIAFDQGDAGICSVWEGKGAINRDLNADGVVGAIHYRNGHGGFSAYGGKLTVTLNSGATIDWSADPTGFNGINGRQLHFGSIYSDNEVELTNPIDLNAVNRYIRVFDNTDTNTDLTVLSGNITGSGAISTFLCKYNDGILWLKGTNTYTQATWIDDGVLRGDWGVGIPTTSQIYFEQNNWDRPGIWETSGAITNNVGPTGEVGTVTWDAQNGGFAAFGGPLTVNLEGGAQLNTTTVNDGFDWHWLQLGSYSANDVVDFQNDILIVDDAFQMSVFDNPYTTNDYAIMSGNITYSGWGDMEVRCNGMLRMTGTNTIRQFRTYGTAKVFINGYHNGPDYMMTENNNATTIGGSGTVVIANWMDIRSSGILAPGDNGVGTFNVTVNLIGTGSGFDMWNGSVYECELGASTNDRLALNGDLILNNTWTLRLLDAGAAPKVSDRFDIITYTKDIYSSMSGSNVASVAVDCSLLPSHYVTNSVQVIHDIANKCIYVTGLSSTLSIRNDEAGSVIDTSAQLNGTLSCTGLAFDVYAYWGETDEGQATNNWSNAVYVASYTNVTEQALSYPAGSLSGDTTYYYTFRASNDTYDIWGGQSAMFQTLGVPAVTNTGATVLRAGSARLSGGFAGHNRGEVTVCWGLSDGGTNEVSDWDHAEELGVQTAASFTAAVADVFYPLTYYYRCFVTNDYGYGWSEPASSFTVTGKPTDYVPAGGLMGYWKFDDDTCDDSSGNEYHGVMVGGSYDAGDVPTALTGGKSINLSAGDYYVKVDTGGSQDVFDLDTLSVSCWVKGWPDGDWEPWVSKRGETGEGWQFRKQGASANNISWTLRGPGNDDWYVTTNINDSAWHHVVATYGGGKRRIYADNKLVGEENRTGAIVDTSDMLVFGAKQNYGGFSYFSRLRLDDICIYDRAITSNEVSQLYNNLAVVLVSITNTAVSDVTTTSAQFNATLLVSNAAYQVYGYWGTNNGGTDISAWSNSADLGWFTNFTGAISHYTTNDINATTTNYYTFRATNALDNMWADPSWNFHTAIAPVVDNGSGAVTSGVGVATLNGELTAGNYADIYVYWGTNDGVEVKGDWGGVVSLGGLFDGTFSNNVTVGYGVTYYYRCYATNAAGDDWADSTEVFIMSVPPALPPLTVTNGLNYKLMADSLGYSDDDPVDQWDDVSGNGRNFTQGTGANQPVFKTGMVNGLPAISFDGTDDRVSIASVTTNETVFIVNRIFSAANAEGILGSDNPADKGIRMKDADEWNGQGGNGDNNDFGWPAGGATYINGAATVFYGVTNSWHILMHQRGSAHSQVYNTTHIGWYYATREYHGQIAEVLMYNRVLSTNERNSVGNYLARKYNLMSSYVPTYYLHLTNEVPASIAANTATLNASLYATGRVFHVFAYWGESNGSTNISSWTSSAFVGTFTNSGGNVSYPATGLTGNTSYFYNFRATNDFTNLWGGASVAFATLGAPAVSNAAATGVTSASATLNGVLTAGGTANARIYWGTNDPGNVYTGWDNTNDLGEIIEGTFSTNVTVLAGGKYYYRVYATNSVGEAWPGGATNFTTPKAAVSLSLMPSVISPTNLPGCVLWLDANDIDGDSDEGDNPANGTAVYSWKDRSGSGHHADNSMGTPHYVTSVLNGNAAVHFTANDKEYLYTTYNFDALSKYSIFAVSRFAGGNNRRVIASKTRNWLFGHNDLENRFYAEGWIYQGNVTASTNWHLYAGTINDDPNPLGAFWADGVRLTAFNGGSSDTVYKPGQLGIGGYLRDNTEYSDCEVSEILMYDRVLNAGELDMVGNYLSQKYGLNNDYKYTQITETNATLTVTATLNVPAISNVTVNLQFPTAGPDALRHWGYNFNNDALYNLDGNAGLLTATPYGKVFLTDGPYGSNGLYFANDTEFINSGAVSVGDNYMNLFHGYLNVTNTGNHEFRIDTEDDIGVMWLDRDLDGVFEHAGASGDEQIIYDGNHGTVTYSLTAGNRYRFATIHREGGGGSVIRAWIKTPAMGSQAVIRPLDAAQQDLWTYDIGIATNITDFIMSSTSIVITAGSLTGSVTLTPVDDALQEEDENAKLRILSVLNATSGLPTTVSAIISSDDPEVTASVASNITYSSASIPGTLTMGDSAWVTVYYGTNDGVTTKGNWGASAGMGRISEDEPFYTSVTGLLANTKYYYRCYATNESLLKEDWSNVTSNFTTLGPTVSIGDRSLVTERDVGTVSLVLTVTMSEVSLSPATVNFTTLDGTAFAGADYLGTNGTLTIPAGQTNGQIVVKVINNTVFNPPPRNFAVLLSSAVGCTILDGRANVTILDDDAATYLSDWQYSMQISLTNCGYSTLINWPALVRLSTGITGFNYGTFSSATGGDLRFSTGDGKSVLVYSIEKWNTSGESIVWVQVPQLPVGGTNIWVYWGNPGGATAPVYTTNSATWGPNYKGIWQLNADLLDATVNNNDGTIYGATAAVAGVIANGVQFDGNDYIDVGAGIAGYPTYLTESAWVKTTDATAMIMAKRHTGGFPWPTFMVYNNKAVISVDDNTYRNDITSGTSVNDGNWHYLTGVKNGTTYSIYVDGIHESTKIDGRAMNGSGNLHIGHHGSWNWWFNGSLDDVRISDTVLSSDWIKTSYSNQCPGSTFNTFGTVRGKPLIVTTNGATNVTGTAAYLTAYLSSTGGAPATVWLCWGTNNGAQVESQWNTVTLIGAVTAVPTNYSTQLTTLTAGTAYYYAYMASNTYGKYWAATNFYTIGKPFIDNSAGAIEDSVSATLRGNLVSTGGLETTVFTYWGDNDGGTSTGSWDYVIAGGVRPEGAFSNNTASILVYGKQYYYRCYATNSAGVNWAAATKLFLSTNPRVNDGSKMKISFPGYVGPTLTNIPMLVVLGEDKPGFTYDGFISGAGNDLRFWNSTETLELNYEIESWSTNYDFEPTTLSGCTLWLDAWDIDGYGDGTTGDPVAGQAVTEWMDKSPLGNRASIASSGPTVAANGINSGPVIRFTGQSMVFDNPVTAQGSTIFVMYRKTANTDGDYQMIMGPYSGAGLNIKRLNVWMAGGTERVLDWNGTGLDIYSGISASEWHVQVMQLVAGDNRIWVDEVLTGPDASGNTFGPFGNVGNMTADIAEVIVYNRTLTDDERKKVGGYLAGKYGLQAGYTPDDESYVWVQIPQLAASNTYIWATWGDTNRVSKPAYTTNGATWSEGYVSVHHFGDGNGSTARNSTSNSYDGTLYNMEDIDWKSGPSGSGALHFNSENGNDEYVDLPDGYANFNSGITVESWIRTDVYANWARIVDFANGAGVDNILLARNGTGDDLRWEFHDTAGGTEAQDIVDLFAIGRWQHFVGTCSTGAVNAAVGRAYRDGLIKGTKTDSSVPRNISRANNYIGKSNWADALQRGWMDEVRISDVERSSNWIWACWMNMASNSVFNTYSNAVDSRVIENGPASQVQDIRAQFNGVLYAKSATYDVYVYWGQTDGGTNSWAWASNAFVGNYTYVFSNNVSYTAQGVHRLIPQTNYFYTFFATNIAGGYWAYPSIALTTEPPYPSLFKIF